MAKQYEEKFIKQAKMLYLQMEKDGTHTYSLRKIASILNKEKDLQGDGTRSISQSSVMRWVNNYGWNDEFMKQLDLKRNILDIPKRRETPDELVESAMRLNAEKAYEQNRELAKISNEILKTLLWLKLLQVQGKKDDRISEEIRLQCTPSNTDFVKMAMIINEREKRFEEMVLVNQQSNQQINIIFQEVGQ